MDYNIKAHTYAIDNTVFVLDIYTVTENDICH